MSFNTDHNPTNISDRLLRRFNAVRSDLSNQRNTQGTILYELEVDLMYALHELKFGPPYAKGDQIAIINQLIKKLEKL